MPGIDSKTKLLLHFDGTDGSASIVDSSLSARSVTVGGGAQIDTTYSVFGGGSGLFDGNLDWLSIADSDDFALSTSDFTFDFWVRIPDQSVSYDDYIYHQYTSGHEVKIYLDNGDTIYENNKVIFEVTSGGTTYTLDSGKVIDNETWYHVLISRYGDGLFLFVGGDLKDTLTMSSSFDIGNIAAAVYIGRADPGYTDTSLYFFLGQLDEFRFSNGIAREHTSNFTPPTEAYDYDYIVTGIPVPIAFSISSYGVVESSVVDALPITVSFSISADVKTDFHVSSEPIVLQLTLSASSHNSPVVSVEPIILTQTVSCNRIKVRVSAPVEIVVVGGLMSLNTYLYNRCHEMIADGTNSFLSHVYKIALMSSSYSPDIDNDEYWSDISSYEVTPVSGYTAGGDVLNAIVVSRNDSTNITTVSWNHAQWDIPYGAQLTGVKGAVVYNDSLATKSLLAFFEFASAMTVPQENSFVVTPIIQFTNGGS